MTGQARVLIHGGGTHISLECIPCRLNKPYPNYRAAHHDARQHNTELHGRTS